MHQPLFSQGSVHIVEDGDIVHFDSFDIEITKVKKIFEEKKAVFVFFDDNDLVILPHEKLKYFERKKYFKNGKIIKEDVLASYEGEFWEEFKKVNKHFF